VHEWLPERIRNQAPEAQTLLYAILSLGLTLRLLFWLVGAPLLYGSASGAIYTNGDSSSYVNSFVNLWQQGHYSFNLEEPQASFGRLPGYPFFVGIHLLLAGPRYYQPAVAVSQILLDTASIGLCYRIAQALRPTTPAVALTAALIYACYPFAILWTTVIGTETLGVFLVLLWAHQLVQIGALAPVTAILVGLLLAAAFLVREYLGILLPITVLYTALVAYRQAIPQLLWRTVGWVLTGFMLLYGWWPLRNAVFHQQLVLVKPVSAGYADMRPDMLAFLDWVHLWSNDNTYWLDEVLQYHQANRFPSRVAPTAADRRLLQHTLSQAYACGSSFHFRRFMNDSRRLCNCNGEVERGFVALSARYRQNHPWRSVLEVPVLNLGKAVFKNQLTRSVRVSQWWLMSGLFTWRSLLVLAGWVGAYRLRRQPMAGPLLAFSGFMYGYICCFFHSLEMRYLLQADMILLVLAASLMEHLVGNKNVLQNIEGVSGLPVAKSPN
jgi:hypothetical protein